jgi:signal transduction histidine kinase
MTTGEVASAVLAETERLQELVEDLLLLARLDEGAVPVATEVDLDDLVLAEAARIRATASVDVDTSAVEASRILGNAGQLERVVRNLAQNASRYARTRLALGVGQRDGQVTLTVDDDGPGIDPSDRERVLERFVRSDESRGRVSGGAGLGLAIVHEVARTHGGDVVLSESPLGGLRAEVHLPATR